MDTDLLYTDTEWRDRVNELQTILDELRPRLIDAEAQLAERLAAVSAFEYRLRARLDPLYRRLDSLQADIDDLRRQLQRLSVAWLDQDDASPVGESWRFEESAASAGSFRYRAKVEEPTPSLEGKRLVSLKQLYRKLAHRFHPDLAPNEADRTYRTDLMMAINAAYTAGDLEALERLANEPDSISRVPQTLQELAAALEREVERCRHRLHEIARELATLGKHQSARLMEQFEQAQAQGRDLLAELAANLRRRISEKLVERDVLESQLDEVEQGGAEVDASDLADIVYNLGLEQADEDDLFGNGHSWRPRRPRPWESNDGEDEDGVPNDF
ncbi:MAG TPA: hypothetical protein PKJ56_04070 [Promineifilum sp.]|nr:hypothetical protein [Promineifilum sp.]